MTTMTMLLVILGCALVTWLPRVLPFILVKNIVLPRIVLRWLAYVPVCILSALVIESLIDINGQIVTFQWLNVVALIPTAFVAILTKSLAKTVVVGIFLMAFLRFIF